MLWNLLSPLLKAQKAKGRDISTLNGAASQLVLDLFKELP